MIAIIPARGGSKGLPGKNVKELAGKPLIAYTIQAAQASHAVTRVVVSTDDPTIAAVAQSYGAEVPFLRPAELATDEARAIDAYVYTIDRLEVESGQTIAQVMVLLPTTPLRNAADIDAAHQLFVDRQADSVISYTKEFHPVSWHKYVDPDGRLPFIPEESLHNRQEYRETYYPNGAIYIFSSKLLRAGKYQSADSFAYLMPRERSIDIDTIDDFELAEFYLRRGP